MQCCFGGEYADRNRLSAGRIPHGSQTAYFYQQLEHTLSGPSAPELLEPQPNWLCNAQRLRGRSVRPKPNKIASLK